MGFTLKHSPTVETEIECPLIFKRYAFYNKGRVKNDQL